VREVTIAFGVLGRVHVSREGFLHVMRLSERLLESPAA